jgi:hypothetical protein
VAGASDNDQRNIIQPIIVPDANDTGADGLHTSGDLWKLH